MRLQTAPSEVGPRLNHPNSRDRKPRQPPQQAKSKRSPEVLTAAAIAALIVAKVVGLTTLVSAMCLSRLRAQRGYGGRSA